MQINSNLIIRKMLRRENFQPVTVIHLDHDGGAQQLIEKIIMKKVG